jgi:hypothetical protein
MVVFEETASPLSELEIMRLERRYDALLKTGFSPP